jgi:methanogenic corrinoid protein MtbC1
MATTPGTTPTESSRATLTVAAVARRLGVAPATLRTWDRRYGLGPSAHTAGSHRRYCAQDVARLVVMRRLALEGVPPAEAARLALSASVHADGGPPSGTPGHGGALDLPASVSSGPHHTPTPGPPVADGAGPWPSGGRHGGGRVVALPDGSPAVRGLARAAMALDTDECARLVRDSLHARGVVRTWNDLATPVLQAVGDRWQITGEGVDVEHAFAETLMGVLRGVTAGLEHPSNRRPVLLTCAEGDHHTLPLHVLAAALAERGVGCRMLGVGLPARALQAAVRRSGPSVVFVYARLATRAVRVLSELPRQRPAPRVLVGGTGWDHAALPDCVGAVGSLDEALVEVVSAVHP